MSALFDKLFKINEDKSLEINREEVYMIDAFSVILRRDRGSKGDIDGRKKFVALRDFKVIYYMSSINSTPSRLGLSEKETIAFLKENINLPNDFKIDKELKTAIDVANKIEETASSYLLVNSIKSLNVTSKVLGVISNKIQERLSIIETNDDDESIRQITNVINLSNEILKLTSNIPRTLEEIEKVQTKIFKEREDKLYARGGVEINDRATVDRFKKVSQDLRDRQKNAMNEEIIRDGEQD
jgi:hypothetical protein